MHLNNISNITVIDINTLINLPAPNRKRFEVTPGRVTEVRLSKPNVVIGMTWTYHIRLTSNQHFVPVMWLGYPVYLNSAEEATPFETCLGEDEKAEHATHHILNVAYRTEGFFVKVRKLKLKQKS